MKSAEIKTSLSPMKIVGFESNEHPISLDVLREKLNRAEKDIAMGKVMTTENARACFKNKFSAK